MYEPKKIIDSIKTWSLIALAISGTAMFASISYVLIADRIENSNNEAEVEKDEFILKFKRPDSLKTYSSIIVRINGIKQYTSFSSVVHLNGDTISIPLQIKEFQRPTIIESARLYHFNNWGLRLDVLSDERINANKEISFPVAYISDSAYPSRMNNIEEYSDSLLRVIQNIEAGLGTMAMSGWVFDVKKIDDSSKND